jgi:hypothetical protein
MYPHIFEEDIGSGLYCDSLLVDDQNSHLGKSSNNHENTVISLLGLRKAQHVIHQDGFPWPVRSRQRGVHSLFLNGWFGNGASRVELDILVDILSKF